MSEVIQPGIPSSRGQSAEGTQLPLPNRLCSCTVSPCQAVLWILLPKLLSLPTLRLHAPATLQDSPQTEVHTVGISWLNVFQTQSLCQWHRFVMPQPGVQAQLHGGSLPASKWALTPKGQIPQRKGI